MVIKFPLAPSSSMVIVSRYVPSLMYRISPAVVSRLTAYCNVSNGAASVPALLSLPPEEDGAT